MKPLQFALFRIVFGAYLCVHFATLVPWAGEVWSNQGVLPDAATSPLHGLFPNFLALFDGPSAVQAFVAALALAAALFAFGIARRSCAALLWYGATCLVDRNPLTSNPGLPYVGLLFLLTILVPPGEGLSPERRRDAWVFPRRVYDVAFLLLMAGYTFSGWTKLSSPSWMDGSAVRLVLENPLARPGMLRDILLSMPSWALACMTWATLALELSALPLCLSRRGRPVAWLALLAMHAGLVLVIDFADLTLGMVMAHLFTFDPGWFASRTWNRAHRVTQTAPQAARSVTARR